jgi:hypothetical protein
MTRPSPPAPSWHSGRVTYTIPLILPLDRATPAAEAADDPRPAARTYVVFEWRHFGPGNYAEILSWGARAAQGFCLCRSGQPDEAVELPAPISPLTEGAHACLYIQNGIQLGEARWRAGRLPAARGRL